MVKCASPVRVKADTGGSSTGKAYSTGCDVSCPSRCLKNPRLASTIGSYSLGGGFRARLIEPLMRRNIPLLHQALSYRRHRIYRQWGRSELVTCPLSRSPPGWIRRAGGPLSGRPHPGWYGYGVRLVQRMPKLPPGQKRAEPRCGSGKTIVPSMPPVTAPTRAQVSTSAEVTRTARRLRRAAPRACRPMTAPVPAQLPMIARAAGTPAGTSAARGCPASGARVPGASPQGVHSPCQRQQRESDAEGHAVERQPPWRATQDPGSFRDRDQAYPEEDDLERTHEHVGGLNVANSGEAQDARTA